MKNKKVRKRTVLGLTAVAILMLGIFMFCGNKRTPVKSENDEKEILPLLCGRVTKLYELQEEKLNLAEADICYLDDTMCIYAEGLWNSATPEIHNQQVRLRITDKSGMEKRLQVGEITAAQAFQEIYVGVGQEGQMAVITQSDSRIHEIFASMDEGGSWTSIGTAESFGACYNRLVSCISFADMQSGVVGCPFIDPAYSVFLYTQNGGETWQPAEFERLENGEEYCYSVAQICLEQGYGAAIVVITTNDAAPDKDGAYLYISEDGGQSWRMERILEAPVAALK